MFSNLSKKLTNALIRQAVVDEDERALYEYGFFLLLSNVFFGALALLAGLLLKMPLSSLLFFAAFRLLREYAGGYHAESETRCLFFSCTAILGSLCLIKGIQTAGLLWVPILPAVFGTIMVALFAPLDTPEKPLTVGEHKHFRKLSLGLLAAADILFAVGFALQRMGICVPVGIAVGLEGLLITLGKIKRIRQQKTTAEQAL